MAAGGQCVVAPAGTGGGTNDRHRRPATYNSHRRRQRSSHTTARRAVAASAHFPTATVSVGRDEDDWAHQVINNVVVDSEEREPAEVASVCEAEAVAAKIAEKKVLFHKDRLLELKNLPDGVTEQVCLRVSPAKYNLDW